jgi:hypothetical protein
MTTSKIEINDGDRNLVQICLEIGRDRFTEYTSTLANPRAIEQFKRQAEDAARLLNLIAEADRITVHVEAEADGA